MSQDATLATLRCPKATWAFLKDSQSTCCTPEGPSDNYSHISNMSRDMGCHHRDLEVQQVWSVTQAPGQKYPGILKHRRQKSHDTIFSEYFNSEIVIFCIMEIKIHAQKNLSLFQVPNYIWFLNTISIFFCPLYSRNNLSIS